MDILKRFSLLSLIIILGAQPTVKSDDSDIFITAGAIGGAILGGFGAYKLVEWLSTENTDQLISRTKKDLKRTENRYNGTIQNLELIFGKYLPDAGQYNVNENILIELRDKSVIDKYDYEKVTSNLEKNIKDLKERKKKIKYSEKEFHYLREIEVLISKTSNFLEKFRSIQQFFCSHSDFFEAHDLLQILLPKYYLEIAISNLKLSKFIKRIKRECATRYGSDYPLKNYHDRIFSDLRSLTNLRLNKFLETLNLKNPRYPVTLGNVTLLIRILNYIKSELEQDADFKQEIRDLERKKLEEERLALQRRETWAKEREANAAQDRATAEWARVRTERDRANAEWARAGAEWIKAIKK